MRKDSKGCVHAMVSSKPSYNQKTRARVAIIKKREYSM